MDRLAAEGIAADILKELAVDYFYSMEGSAIRGTMLAGALKPVVRVTAIKEVDAEPLRRCLLDALPASAIGALWRETHRSLFIRHAQWRAYHRRGRRFGGRGDGP